MPGTIVRTFNNNKLISNKLTCSLVKRPNIKVELNLTEEQVKTANQYIGPPKLFSDIIIVCDVKPITYYNKKEVETLLIGTPHTMYYHIPKNSYRTMITGAKLTKEEFEKIYKKCIFCDNPIAFEDINLKEDHMGDNILCGVCVTEAEEKRNGGYTVDALFQMARNE